VPLEGGPDQRVLGGNGSCSSNRQVGGHGKVGRSCAVSIGFRNFKTKRETDREDLFAATPPLELLKAQLSRAASNNKARPWSSM
jgi:hypothetical protein